MKNGVIAGQIREPPIAKHWFRWQPCFRAL